MKKNKLKYLIFSIIGISTIISLAVTIPYALSSQAEKYNLELNSYNIDLGKAQNLTSRTNFNSAEFDKLVANLKVKPKFAKRLNAFDALNFHFDKSYSFDLADAVDLSSLSQKYPDLSFKLVIPDNKSRFEIKENKLKNIGLNVTNHSKTINYTAKFDLDFSGQEKAFQFLPENFTGQISLRNLESLKGKTATEIAILFYNAWLKRFNKLSDSKIALYETFGEFGGASFSLNSEPIFILPENFEIKPDLKDNKLVFASINDEKNELVLNMVLYDKTAKTEKIFPLRFVDLPKTNQKYGEKFLASFLKNYEFNSEISKYLAKNNLDIAQLFSLSSNPKSLDLTKFESWFIQKSVPNTTFFADIKGLIPNFEAKKAAFLVKKPEKVGQNKNLLTINLKLEGTFLVNDQVPAGLNLTQDKQYTYNFDFDYDATQKIYSGYFRNALELFDAKTAKNLDNLKLEVKSDLPVTVFASTINTKIAHLLNKPLELKGITKKMSPLFDFLNFSTSKNEKLETKMAPPNGKMQKVGAVLFNEEVKQQESQEKGQAKEEKSSKDSQSEQTDQSEQVPKVETKTIQAENGGTYLSKLFENLEKTSFPTNTLLYLSTFYRDKFILKLELKVEGITKETLEIKIDKVAPDNKAYQALVQSTNTDLFLDWRSNITTTTEKYQNKPVLASISALNNPNLKFKVNPEPSNKSQQKVHLDQAGIYLAEGGISLENSSQEQSKNLKLDEGKTIFYAFKPTKLSRRSLLRYFLLSASDNSSSKFSLLIEPEIQLTGFNKIGADFEKVEQNNKIQLKWTDASGGLQKTFNGTYQDIYYFLLQLLQYNKVALYPKNQSDKSHDFLNAPAATMVLVATVESEKTEKYLKMKLFSSDYQKGKKEIFSWKAKIESQFQNLDLAKNLTLGTTKSNNQENIDKEQQDDSRKPTGITLKGFALFDKPKDNQKYNNILEKFLSEYME